jgi:hypothetical protein
MKDFVRRFTSFPFRRFLGDVRRELMQGLCVILHGTLGSYLRIAFNEGGLTVVACLLAPRAQAYVLVFFLFWSISLLSL